MLDRMSHNPSMKSIVVDCYQERMMEQRIRDIQYIYFKFILLVHFFLLSLSLLSPSFTLSQDFQKSIKCGYFYTGLIDRTNLTTKETFVDNKKILINLMMPRL